MSRIPNLTKNYTKCGVCGNFSQNYVFNPTTRNIIFRVTKYFDICRNCWTNDLSNPQRIDSFENILKRVVRRKKLEKLLS